MTLFSKIKLSWRYGKSLYVISSLLTLSSFALVMLVPDFISVCIILKLLSVPIVLFLCTSFTRESEIYFYLNLGISRNEYYVIPSVLEFIVFVLLMIIAVYTGHAIR